jgi:hypothetical protein
MTKLITLSHFRVDSSFEGLLARGIFFRLNSLTHIKVRKTVAHPLHNEYSRFQTSHSSDDTQNATLLVLYCGLQS